jgi:hypothetical protein
LAIHKNTRIREIMVRTSEQFFSWTCQYSEEIRNGPSWHQTCPSEVIVLRSVYERTRQGHHCLHKRDGSSSIFSIDDDWWSGGIHVWIRY